VTFDIVDWERVEVGREIRRQGNPSPKLTFGKFADGEDYQAYSVARDRAGMEATSNMKVEFKSIGINLMEWMSDHYRGTKCLTEDATSREQMQTTLRNVNNRFK
jgi:hypothetical protein